MANADSRQAQGQGREIASPPPSRITVSHASLFKLGERTLAEMDATLTSLEASLGAFHAEKKKQAEKAVSEIRAQREAFEEAVRKEQHEWDAWARAKIALDADWTAFETIVQKYT